MQDLYPRITEVRVIEPYRVELTFSDGSRGVVDVALLIGARRGMLEPLKDPEFFALVTVDQEAGTIVWPNGADIDPDVLYEAAHPGSDRISRLDGARL